MSCSVSCCYWLRSINFHLKGIICLSPSLMSSVNKSKRVPFDVFSFLLIHEVFTIPNHVSIWKCKQGFSIHLLTLKNIEVHFMVMCFAWDDSFEVWIPNNNVCVWANLNKSFSWIHIENLCRPWRSGLNKLILW